MNHPFDSSNRGAQGSRKLSVISLLVALTGLITISSLLFALLHLRRSGVDSTDAHLTALAGLSLIYLATLLNRGKYTAWLVSVPIYIFLVARNIRYFVIDFPHAMNYHSAATVNLALPLLTLLLLVVYRRLFTVRSEVRSFTTALTRSFIILLVAFVYGVAGFSLLDSRDFHQEIAPLAAAHYTVDQFGLTTDKQVVAHTKRSRVFLDSLAVVSFGAVFYSALALFSPIRFRLSNHRQDYEDIRRILARHSTTSEDFFKLWPADKAYFFNGHRTAAIAYRATHSVALIVGDPVGPKNEIRELLNQFMGFCRINDWQPAFIHTEETNLELYESLGFEAQKIGEEAIISTEKFVNQVGGTKDFRHIKNKFEKLGYKTEMIKPPHSQETLTRLRAISDDWLKGSGRAERGFMLGYFTNQYMQLCNLMVAKDGHGEIKAFINQVPSPTASEANFDFLRHGRGAPGNINDFLMLNFISSLYSQGISKLNMGLSPLFGLQKANDGASSLLNGFLNFAYANGNRFYSFHGLKRFKTKYEPDWESRYIIYRGGLRGFTKTINSLMFAMRVKLPRRRQG
jgi:phosphatidylglycerol lysyltransferase